METPSRKKGGKKKGLKQPHEDDVVSKSIGDTSISNDALEESKMNDMMNIMGMEKKNEIFQQLWKGIAQLQHDSGDTVNAFKAKERELESAKKEIVILTKQSQETRDRELKLIKQVELLQDDVVSERKERNKLSEELSNLEDSSQKKIKELELSSSKFSLQLKETVEKNGLLSKAVEITKVDLEGCRSQIKLLRKEVQEKNEEIKKLDPTAIPERNKLREKVALLSSQIKTEAKERDDMTRHVSNLTNENSSLHMNIAKLNELKDDTESEIKTLKETIARDKTKHEEATEKLKKIHTDLIGKLQDADLRLAKVQQSSRDESESLRNTINQMEEKIAHVKKRDQGLQDMLKEQKMDVEKIQKKHEDQLAKLRASMAGIQEKHLKDVVTFDKEKRSFEERLEQITNKKDHAESRILQLEQQLSSLDKTTKSREIEIEKEQKDWMAQLEQQYQGKITQMLTDHSKATNDLKTQLAEAKVAAKRELRNAQEYKTTLAKAAKEEHVKLAQQLEHKQHEVEELGSKFAKIQEEKTGLELTIKNQQDLHEHKISELQSREEELQRALVATQHQVTSAESNFSRDTEKLRAEVDKFKKRTKALEEQKQELIIDCKKFNDEAAQGNSRVVKAEERATRAEEVNTKLMREIDRLKKASKELDAETEERIERLQEEIDEHVKSRREALTVSEQIRGELKIARKEAAEQVGMFSNKTESLAREVQSLTKELNGKKGEIQNLSKEREGLQQQLSKLQEQSNALNDVHGKEISDLVGQLNEANHKLEETERLRETVKERNNQVEEIQKQIDDIKAKRQTTIETLRETELSKQRTIERLSTAEENNRELLAEIERRKHAYTELNKELSSSRAEKNALTRTFASKESKYHSDTEQLKLALQRAQSETDNARKELVALNKRCVQLQDASEQNLAKYSSELNSMDNDHKQIVKQLRTELKEKENLLLDEKNNYSRYSKHTTSDLERKKAEIERLKQCLASSQESGTNILQELEEKTSAYDSLTADFESLGKSLQNLEKRLSSTEKAKKALEEDLDHEKKLAFDIRSQMQHGESDMKSKLRAEQESHQVTRKELSTLKQEKDWLQNETNIKISALGRQVQNLEADLKRKENDATLGNQKLQEIQNDHNRFREAANKAINKLREEKDKEQTERKRELDEARQAAEQASQLLSNMQQERLSLEKKIKDLTGQIDAHVLTIDETKGDLEKAVRNYKELVAQKRKLDNENKKLKLQISNGSSIGATTVNDDTEERMQQIEQEAYRSAQEEYKNRLSSLEKEHAEQIAQLQSQLATLKNPHTAFFKSPGRPDDSFTRSGPMGEFIPPSEDLETASLHSYEDFQPPLETPPTVPPSNAQASPSSASINDTAAFLEARRHKGTDEMARRHTMDGPESFRLPAAKGATPQRQTFDSFEALEAMARSQSESALRTNSSGSGKGKRKTKTRLPKV